MDLSIVTLADGVYCASGLDDEMEMLEAFNAIQQLGLSNANELFAINNMDLCDDRLHMADQFVVQSGKCGFDLAYRKLSVDGIDVIDANNGIGFFIRKSDYAAFMHSRS